MGVRLYLRSIMRENEAKYGAKFGYWMEKKDAWEEAGKKDAADKALQQAMKYCDKLHERGYFGDNCENSNLLRLFDLSWWEDVWQSLTDVFDEMSPENAERFLHMLGDRESVLEANLRKVEPDTGETREEAKEYLRGQYERLKALLRESINRGECIDCHY